LIGLSLWQVLAVADVVLMAGIAACASDTQVYYRDPELPPDQVATFDTHTVEVFWVLGGNAVAAKSIDHLPLYFRDIGLSAEVKLAPGAHEIGASYSGKEGYEASFPVKVQAGHRYQIRSGKEDKLIRIWVEDIDTKAVVGMVTLAEAGSGS
jgi:hypothetical protein